MKNRNNQILKISKLLSDMQRHNDNAVQAIQDSNNTKQKLERALMELEIMNTWEYKADKPEKN
jgi:hypothetical protein